MELVSINSGIRSVRNADMLLKMNIAPIMARRDASLDIAEALVLNGRLEQLGGCDRRDGYWQIVKHLQQAAESSAELLMLFNSPDTRRREQLFLEHLQMLHSLGVSLANFFELRGMMLCNEKKNDSAEVIKTMDENETARISTMITGVEHDLFTQLNDCFQHSRHKVIRYRGYVEKSFSMENARRYKLSYCGYVRVNNAVLDKFKINV